MSLHSTVLAKIRRRDFAARRQFIKRVSCRKQGDDFFAACSATGHEELCTRRVSGWVNWVGRRHSRRELPASVTAAEMAVVRDEDG